MLSNRFCRLRELAKAENRLVTDDEQEAVVRAAMDDVRVLVYDQAMFQYAYRHISSEVQVEEINGSEGARLKLAAVELDNFQINKVARSCFHADIVVQRNSIGHTHIFTVNDAKLCLDDLAQALNVAERTLAGDELEINWADLRAGGFGYDGGKWHYSLETG